MKIAIVHRGRTPVTSGTDYATVKAAIEADRQENVGTFLRYRLWIIDTDRPDEKPEVGKNYYQHCVRTQFFELLQKSLDRNASK
jgi:hypothetical protein